MLLKQFMKTHILHALNTDLEDALLGNLDKERRADTFHHSRKTAYTAAFGVFGPMDDSPVKGDERVWDMVVGMFDMVCDWQREDGLWDWYVPATQKTHRLNYVWSVYSWLRLV